MKPMIVIEIVHDCIEKNGYDGLYSEDSQCACELGNLAPCGNIEHGCTMGYRYVCNDEGCEYYGYAGEHWHMRATK